MNAKTLTTAALGGWLAIILGVAWFNYRAAQDAKSALDLLAKRRAALTSGMRRGEEQVAVTNRENTNIRSALATPSQDSVPKSKVRITQGLNGRAILALMAADPKLYALGMKAFRAGMPVTFGRLFRALNLNPDQIDKFETLTVQHQEAVIDIVSTANEQGVQMNDPAVATLMQQENSQYQSAQQALLGDAGYQQMQQLNRSGAAMGIVNNVANSVALTSTPLTGMQGDQLAQILANASSQYQNGGNATQATINWPAALAQAQGILSPTQFQALQSVYSGSQIAQFKTQFDNQEKAAR